MMHDATSSLTKSSISFLFCACLQYRFFFGRRNNDSAEVGERPKSVHQIAKELRMQKIKEYEIKIKAAKAAEENERNDLQLSVLPETEKATPTPALVDDVTETNSPMNSDNDDPTIDDDDEDDEDNQQPDSNAEQQQSPPGSPLSVLSMGTKPVLIHPPRSITRVEDENSNDVETENENDNHNPLGVLCGCI